MVTRDPGAPFDTPNVVIGRQGRNELTLSFRPPPYLHTGAFAIKMSNPLPSCIELRPLPQLRVVQGRYLVYMAPAHPGGGWLPLEGPAPALVANAPAHQCPRLRGDRVAWRVASSVLGAWCARGEGWALAASWGATCPATPGLELCQVSPGFGH